jgi:hypothetical protein
MTQGSADLDGVVAAPEHHRVLFENDRVRVVETFSSAAATGNPLTRWFPASRMPM